jgi:hypothetical protein
MNLFNESLKETHISRMESSAPMCARIEPLPILNLTFFCARLEIWHTNASYLANQPGKMQLVLHEGRIIAIPDNPAL